MDIHIKYYKDHLSLFNFLEKETGVKINIYKNSIYMALFPFFIATYANIKMQFRVVLFMLTAIFILYSFVVLDIALKRATFILLGKTSTNRHWLNEEILNDLYILRKKKLISYFRNKCNKNQVNELGIYLETKIDSMFFKIPIIPSFIFVVTTIIFDNFLGEYLKIINIQNLNILLIAFIRTVILILIFLGVIYLFIKYVVIKSISNIYVSKQNELKEFLKLIEDVKKDELNNKRSYFE